VKTHGGTEAFLTSASVSVERWGSKSS